VRVLVCGGRNYGDKRAVFTVLDGAKAGAGIDVIIEGGAVGADRLAALWAHENDVVLATFHSDWRRLGRAAGVIRNQQMLDEGKPDLVIAFPGGVGTEDMVVRATKAGVPVMRYPGDYPR
jgi:hypothetical protein